MKEELSGAKAEKSKAEQATENEAKKLEYAKQRADDLRETLKTSTSAAMAVEVCCYGWYNGDSWR
eukprot:364896-Pleurochrysis_carterae.AAC.1